MYRGSTFLLQHAYTIHQGVIDQLIMPQFSVLWSHEFGAGADDSKLVPIILTAVNAIREAYRPFAPSAESRQASDKLVTKILLGTFGCLPACDTYFVKGVRSAGIQYSSLNRVFIERILRFCKDHREALREEQRIIKKSSGVFYLLMKLIGMYFWQIGVLSAADRFLYIVVLRPAIISIQGA